MDSLERLSHQIYSRAIGEPDNVAFGEKVVGSASAIAIIEVIGELLLSVITRCGEIRRPDTPAIEAGSMTKEDRDGLATAIIEAARRPNFAQRVQLRYEVRRRFDVPRWKFLKSANLVHAILSTTADEENESVVRAAVAQGSVPNYGWA